VLLPGAFVLASMTMILSGVSNAGLEIRLLAALCRCASDARAFTRIFFHEGFGLYAEALLLLRLSYAAQLPCVICVCLGYVCKGKACLACERRVRDPCRLH